MVFKKVKFICNNIHRSLFDSGLANNVLFGKWNKTNRVFFTDSCSLCFITSDEISRFHVKKDLNEK